MVMKKKEECPKDFDAKAIRIVQCEALLSRCTHVAQCGGSHITLVYVLQDSLVKWFEARGFKVRQPRFSALFGNEIGRISW